MIDLAAKALLKLAADCRDSEGVTLPKERALKIATAIDNVLVRLETAEATPASSPAGGDDQSRCGFPFCSCAKRGVCAHAKEDQPNG